MAPAAGRPELAGNRARRAAGRRAAPGDVLAGTTCGDPGAAGRHRRPVHLSGHALRLPAHLLPLAPHRRRGRSQAHRRTVRRRGARALPRGPARRVLRSARDPCGAAGAGRRPVRPGRAGRADPAAPTRPCPRPGGGGHRDRRAVRRTAVLRRERDAHLDPGPVAIAFLHLVLFFLYVLVAAAVLELRPLAGWVRVRLAAAVLLLSTNHAITFPFMGGGWRTGIEIASDLAGAALLVGTSMALLRRSTPATPAEIEPCTTASTRRSSTTATTARSSTRSERPSRASPAPAG